MIVIFDFEICHAPRRAKTDMPHAKQLQGLENTGHTWGAHANNTDTLLGHVYGPFGCGSHRLEPLFRHTRRGE